MRGFFADVQWPWDYPPIVGGSHAFSQFIAQLGSTWTSAVASMFILIGLHSASLAQTPPSPTEIAAYTGLHRAAHDGNISQINQLLAGGADTEANDSAGRTPLLVAAFASRDGAVRALAAGGANMNAFDNRSYDLATIAAVADDLEMLETGLELGTSASNITSPYVGTALIAAAHLGHYRIVARLIEAGAPLDHINNLAWTALIEAVVLGDGGPDHTKTVRALVDAGANVDISDQSDTKPLELARARGYNEIAHILSVASQ